MIRMCMTLLTILLFWSGAKSQEIKVDNINKNCKCKATAIDSIITQIKTNNGQSIESSKVHNNPVSPKERISFLNNDFSTKDFLLSCEVKCSDFAIEGGFHFGVIDIGLEKKDKAKCLKAIKSSLRQNFKVKVLTKFKVIEKANELIIMYTETPYDRTMEKLFVN